MDVEKNKVRINYACLECLDAEYTSYLIITGNMISTFKKRDIIQF